MAFYPHLPTCKERFESTVSILQASNCHFQVIPFPPVCSSPPLPPSEPHAIAWSIITIIHWLLGHCPTRRKLHHQLASAAKLYLLAQAAAAGSLGHSFPSTWIPVPFASIPLQHNSFLSQNPNVMFTQILWKPELQYSLYTSVSTRPSNFQTLLSS